MSPLLIWLLIALACDLFFIAYLVIDEVVTARTYKKQTETHNTVLRSQLDLQFYRANRYYQEIERAAERINNGDFGPNQAGPKRGF